jgi:hypothetical protein
LKKSNEFSGLQGAFGGILEFQTDKSKIEKIDNYLVDSEFDMDKVSGLPFEQAAPVDK